MSQPNPPGPLNNSSSVLSSSPTATREASNRPLRVLEAVSPYTLGPSKGLETKGPHSLQNLLDTE